MVAPDAVKMMIIPFDQRIQSIRPRRHKLCWLSLLLVTSSCIHTSASNGDNQNNVSSRSLRRLQAQQQQQQQEEQQQPLYKAEVNDGGVVGKTVAHENAKNTMDLQRLLQSGDLLALTSFPECIEQNLSPDACRSFIEGLIDNAGGHRVGDVEVKIQVPRTPNEFADSYWMAEVPSDIYSKVACDRNNAIITYPFLWDDGSAGGGVPVESVDCFGLSAGQCCVKIRNYGKTLTASGGYDVNDQCLSCFAYREPLVPVFNEFIDSTDYVEFRLLADDVTGDEICTRFQLTQNEVIIEDSEQDFRSFIARDELETFMNRSPRSCNRFDTVLEALYDAAIAFPSLPQMIGELACSICYGSNDKALDDPTVTALMNEIMAILEPTPPSALENCIIIYTTQDGTVATVPTLGGSRSDLDDDEFSGGGGVGQCLCLPNQVCEPNPNSGGALECRDKTCDEDPAVCADNETCDDFGSGIFECRLTRCNEDPSVCGPDEVCDLLPSEEDPYYFTYQCRPESCFERPSLCTENQYCVKSEFASSEYECALDPCSLDPSPCPDGFFCELLFPKFGLDFECKDLGYYRV